MRLEPLGDQAVMAYCAEEQAAARLARRLRRAAFPWAHDVVQAYTSVALFYKLEQIDFQQAAQEIARLPEDTHEREETGQRHDIPCCYDLGLDFARLHEHTGLSKDEVIGLHTGTEYTVYAIGFCPGFPYLGYLPDRLAGVPRLLDPRLRVEPGSVGLTGRQTGIYTEARPGGWNIVGRTPLELVNVRDGYFPLRTGDRVRFHPITKREFKKKFGQRLAARLIVS